MRRPSTLKNKRYLAGPYLFWSISFVVIPLLVVFYYAMTNDEGSITFANLAQITTQENLKALGMSITIWKFWTFVVVFHVIVTFTLTDYGPKTTQLLYFIFRTFY